MKKISLPIMLTMLFVQAYAQSPNALYINSIGKVAIGDPDSIKADLHIYRPNASFLLDASDYGSPYIYLNRDATTTAGLKVQYFGNTYAKVANTWTGSTLADTTNPNRGGIYFAARNTDRMILTGSGKLGIGKGITTGTGADTVAADLHIFKPDASFILDASNYGSPSIYLKRNEDHNTGLKIHYFGNTYARIANTWDGTGASLPNQGGMFLATRDTNRITITGLLGYVGIGTTCPDEMLTVNGNIKCVSLIQTVDVPDCPDYVFEKDYKLMPLKDVDLYVNKYKHLPDIPSAEEMSKNGINSKELELALLRKVEELTLYVIELNKTIENLKSEKVKKDNQK
ncbi:MAG: hypothetical protein V4590_04865 [Bacteroidota bacterium]